MDESTIAEAEEFGCFDYANAAEIAVHRVLKKSGVSVAVIAVYYRGTSTLKYPVIELTVPQTIKMIHLLQSVYRNIEATNARQNLRKQSATRRKSVDEAQ